MSDLHAEALATLRAWRAPSIEQARLQRDYLDFVSTHDDADLRTCFPGHLTTSALVVSADAGHVLLTLHAKAGQWFQVGGHTEAGDSSMAAAALREATEESGMTGLVIDPTPVHLDRHPVSFCHPRGVVDHLDVRFVVTAPAGAQPQRSEESRDVRWFAPDALPTAESSIRDLVELSLRRRR